MPLSGGTAGPHDDSMHQGNAKRDVANGVAGLESHGYLLAPGRSLQLYRDAFNGIDFVDRKSGEQYAKVERLATNNYSVKVNKNSILSELLNAADKDVVNGVAALDAAGGLLVKGSKIHYTRDGSDDVHIYERTSNEEAYAFHRVGADDYTFFVKESNVWKQMQTESMKDIVNGIAGLDANILLSPALLPPCMEEYSNHLGAVDNFTQTGVTGTGSASSDAANHEMDLSTGGGVGRAWFETKAVRVVGSKPMMINMLIQNIQDGAGGARLSFVGCSASFSAAGDYNSMGFRYTDSGVWQTFSADASVEEYNAITALANGDLVSILATSAAIRFFVNGTLVQTHTTRIPAVGVKLGGYVRKTVSAGTVDRSLSIDMMSLRRYL